MDKSTRLLSARERDLYEMGVRDGRVRWLGMEYAPKDFTPILAVGRGADGRPLRAIVRWGCATHRFRSDPACGADPTTCQWEWIGEMGTRYGIAFTWFQHLPEPPKDL